MVRQNVIASTSLLFELYKKNFAPEAVKENENFKRGIKMKQKQYICCRKCETKCTSF